MSTLNQTQTPNSFQIHTTESAQNGTSETLGVIQQKFGFLPNLLGVFANAPSALNAYLALGDSVSKTSLTPLEQNILLLATSIENKCEYCVAAHTAISKMDGIPDPIVDALRSGRRLEDPKLQAFRLFVQEVTSLRGRPSKDTLDRFFAHGYSKQNALEVVLGVTMKTLSNYTNHLAETPLDSAFQSFVWNP